MADRTRNNTGGIGSGIELTSPQSKAASKKVQQSKEAWFDEMKHDTELAQPKGVHTRKAMQVQLAKKLKKEEQDAEFQMGVGTMRLDQLLIEEREMRIEEENNKKVWFEMISKERKIL